PVRDHCAVRRFDPIGALVLDVVPVRLVALPHSVGDPVGEVLVELLVEAVLPELRTVAELHRGPVRTADLEDGLTVLLRLPLHRTESNVLSGANLDVVDHVLAPDPVAIEREAVGAGTYMVDLEPAAALDVAPVVVAQDGVLHRSAVVREHRDGTVPAVHPGDPRDPAHGGAIRPGRPAGQREAV